MKEEISKKFTALVKDKLTRIGKSQISLAKDLGIEYGALNKILNDYQKLDYATAIEIMQILNMDPKALLQYDYNSDYEEACELLRQISNRDIKELLPILKHYARSKE